MRTVLKVVRFAKKLEVEGLDPIRAWDIAKATYGVKLQEPEKAFDGPLKVRDGKLVWQAE